MNAKLDHYTLLCLTKGFPLTEEDAQELRDWAEEREDEAKKQQELGPL